MPNTVKKSTFLFPVRDAVDADKVTLVSVSRDFYIKTTREINNKRKRLQRSGECCCPRNFMWKCDGNCDRCRYHIPDPALLHLDAPIKMDENLSLMDTIADDAPRPEEIIAHKELLDALIRELAQFDERERRMCALMSAVSEREAAKQMGLPRNTLAYRWAKLREKLAKNLNEYR
ncbi:RNA polymerase sigma factor [Selenomonas sp. oral taxon 138]|uniref:RNA polymerase sigma factor n=1 Tax=Selenomonas sp. oral taxon 138 TaxID=712532 RepID=UPI0002A2FFCC|nr:sigma-70 family RNA polymerase sigma factor [Selenomonas sp. oral taxon 138]EKY00529.1 hypothetical protein HMPREF9163_00401 [Selenomonas sp. oral taxon 138 str. F0429]